MTQLIQFEGCTVAVIAPEDLEELEAKAARLAEVQAEFAEFKKAAAEAADWGLERNARLAEAERLLRECRAMFVRLDIAYPFAIEEFFAPSTTADSANASPYQRWKCPHCGWDNVDSVCFACKRAPGCDHLWSADDSDGVLLCLRCGNKEPK